MPHKTATPPEVTEDGAQRLMKSVEALKRRLPEHGFKRIGRMATIPSPAHAITEQPSGAVTFTCAKRG